MTLLQGILAVEFLDILDGVRPVRPGALSVLCNYVYYRYYACYAIKCIKSRLNRLNVIKCDVCRCFLLCTGQLNHQDGSGSGDAVAVLSDSLDGNHANHGRGDGTEATEAMP